MKIEKNLPSTWMNWRNSAIEPLQQLHVIREVDEAGAQDGPDERQHREQEDQPLLVEPPPGVAGQAP